MEIELIEDTRPDASDRYLLINLESILRCDNPEIIEDIKSSGIENTVIFFNDKAYVFTEVKYKYPKESEVEA